MTLPIIIREGLAMQTIKNRITLIIFLLLIILFFSAYLVYHSLNSLGYSVMERSSLILAKSIEEGLYNILGRTPVHLNKQEKERLRKLMTGLATGKGNILSILLIDSSKTIVVSNDPTVEGNIYRSQEQLNLLDCNQPTIYRRNWEKDLAVIDVIVPLNDINSEVYGYLRVVLSRKEVASYLKDITSLLIPIFLAFGIIFFSSFYFIARAYKIPLSSLTQAVAKIKEGDYSYRINYQRKDEFSDTFSILNQTIEEVEYLKQGYKKAEKRISSLIQAVNESILVLDLNKDITSFNDATLSLFKYKNGDFNTWFSSILTSNMELNNLITDSINQSKPVNDRQLPIFLPDNNEIFVKLNIQPLKEDDKILGAVLTFKDLHLINELENNLLRSMKFGIITNLASSISHEIRNPLSALALHAETLSTRIDKIDFNDKDKMTTSIDTIKNEAKRLNHIINQFLSLARPSRLKLDLININQVIEKVMNIIKHQAKNQNINISLQLAAKLESIYGDEDQLIQVLLNIILNGFAAIEQNGKISICSKMHDGKIYIDIKDTGQGIPLKIQDRIFDLYFSTKKEGGGIGLSVCKNIIEAHEGRITFKSKIGEGTTFTIEIPVKDPTTVQIIRPNR
jgi:signal transduction histidine kinase